MKMKFKQLQSHVLKNVLFFSLALLLSLLNNCCFNRTDTESARVYAECVPPNCRLCDVSTLQSAPISVTEKYKWVLGGERSAEYNDRSLPNCNTGFSHDSCPNEGRWCVPIQRAWWVQPF